MNVREPKGELMGINRWSNIEERKRNETNAKAGEEVPKGNRGIPLLACRPQRNPPRTRRNVGFSRTSRSASGNPSLARHPSTRYRRYAHVGFREGRLAEAQLPNTLRH
jgi:hypothetical protein